jgi:hypothetical protein
MAPSRLTGGACIRLFVSVEDVDNRLPKRGAFGSAEKLLTPLYASRRRRRTPAREALSARTLTPVATALSSSSQGEISMASSLPPPSRRVSSPLRAVRADGAPRQSVARGGMERASNVSQASGVASPEGSALPPADAPRKAERQESDDFHSCKARSLTRRPRCLARSRR